MGINDAVMGDPGFDPSVGIDNLIRSQDPDVGAVEPNALADRLARKLETKVYERRQRVAPSSQTKVSVDRGDGETKAESKPDLSNFGVPADSVPDLSSFGVPADQAPAPTAAQPGIGFGGNLAAAGKGLIQGGITGTGDVLKGAGVAMSQPAMSPAVQTAAAGFDPANESAWALPGAPNPELVQPGTPPQQHPLYKAGEATRQFGESAVPMTPAEKDSIGGRVGLAAGGVAPYLVAGAVSPPAGFALGVGGMGLQAAGSTFDEAKKKGASDEDAASAAGLSGLVGGALGAVPLGTVLTPVKKYAPALTGWAAAALDKYVASPAFRKVAASAGAMAAVGEAQEYLGEQIAKSYYDPKAGYSPDIKRVIANLITGGVLGGMHAVSDRVRDSGKDQFGNPKGTEYDTAARGRDNGDGTFTYTEAPNMGGGGYGWGPKRKGPDADATGAPGAGPGPTPGGPASEEAKSGVGREKLEKILRYYGYADDEIAAMSHAEMYAAVQTEMGKNGPRAKPDEAASTAQAEPQAEPKQSTGSTSSTEQAERDGLKRYGFTEAEIDGMSPSRRRRKFQETMASGQAEPEAPESTSRNPDEGGAETASVRTGTREEPIKAATADDVLKAEPAQPTEAQAAAENYRHAHIELDQLGLTGRNNISVETGVGGVRKGTGADGKPWEVTLEHAAYGRIKGTTGADGEPLDIFVGPHPSSPHVFVVDQHDPATGKFDEHKILAGFRTPIDALHAYAHSYTDHGKDRIGHVTAMTPDDFKAWLKSGDTTSPLKKEPASTTHGEEAGSSALTEAPESVPKVGEELGATASPAATTTAKGENRSAEPASLLQFIASKGGLKPHGDLAAMDLRGDHRVNVPGRTGRFPTVRANGMSLDAMRRAAQEAGYFPQDKPNAPPTGSVRDFLNAIEDELRGNHKFAEGAEDHKPKRRHVLEKEASDAARDKAIAEHADDIETEYPGTPDDVKQLAASIMADERLPLDDAVERAAMRLLDSDPDYDVTPEQIAETFGEGAIDAVQPQPAPEDGEHAPREREARSGPQEGEEEGGAGKHAAAAGAEGQKTELTEAGEQAVIPGAEKIGQGEQAQRAADTALKPKVAQKGTDIGLFGDERNQTEMGFTPSQMRKLLSEEQESIVNMWHEIQRPLSANASDHTKSTIAAYRRELAKNGFDRARTEDDLRDMLLDQRLSGDMVKATMPEPIEASDDDYRVVEEILGPDADQVAPADIQRAAELLAEHPDMPPATAFGQAVVLNAVDQGLLTEKEVIDAYGEEAKDLLESRGEGASERGASADTESPAALQEPANPAETEIVPRRSEGREGAASETGEGAGDDTAGAVGTAEQRAAGRNEAARDQTGDTAENRAAAEVANDTVKPHIEAEEPSHGLQVPVSPGDGRSGPEDVRAPATGERAGQLRGEKVAGSRGDVRAADEGRAENAERLSEGAVGEGSGASGEGSLDRVSGARKLNETERRAQRDVEQAADRVEGENYSIAPGSLREDRSFRTKALDNIRAIELSRQIIAEDRPATRAEQQELALYVGWGGIKGAFPDGAGSYAKGFEVVGPRLKAVLTPEQYETARRSIQYAHYTPGDIVNAMWGAVRRMGFEGGQVFEPGMGVGNFAGMMPPDVAAKTMYHGAELDHTTAQIAKLLYPKWGVRQADFTEMRLPDNTYDLVIGNPPFADVSIRSDAKYPQGFLLHDYFFAKSLDSVRPGGLLAFVTSAGTMNKIDPSARNYLADRADLVGAVRLPGNAFKENAGTDVTTDIIVLRKRLPGEAPADRSWTDAATVTLPGSEGAPIKGAMSRYFADHPEMVLGEQGFFDKLYKNRYAVRAPADFDFPTELAKAMDRLPSDVMSPWDGDTLKHGEADFTAKEKKEGTFYIGPNGDLHQIDNGVGKPVAGRGKGVEGGKTAADMDRIKGLIPVRDSLRDVYAADLADDKPAADKAREALNKHYDAFVEKFGPINKAVIQKRRPNVIQQEAARAEAREEARYAGESYDEGSFNPRGLPESATLSQIARARQEARTEIERAGGKWNEGSFDPEDMPDVIIDKRPNVDPFMDDPESYRLRAIEKYDEASGRGFKTPVFSENVIKRTKAPEIKSTNDALLYALNQKGRVDVPTIAAMVHKTEAQVIEELGNRVFKTPGTTDAFETSDAYLSGDVRKKLSVARAAAEKNPEFKRNVKALEAAQPNPLAPSQIHATLGMPWLPEETVRDFGTKELGLDTLRVKYIPALAQWVVSGDTGSMAASTTYGTVDRRAPALIEDALNHRNPKIYDKIWVDGKERSELNVAKTQAAQDKMAAIRDKFADWIWRDQDRADNLAAMYNEKYNNLVVREYDGSHLTTPGISADWSWRPHQTRGIARIIQSGNTYLAHAVGAGKTSEMIGAVMEQRRLGLVRKPMIAVPNHMLAQLAKEFYEQYPTARLAIADEKRFHTDKRKQFIADVATSDLDAIIITHSAFATIPVSDKFQSDMIGKELTMYRQLLNDLTGGDNRITRSRVEKQIERLEQRLKGKGIRRKDAVFTFEEMGVDQLLMDEAHMFRKLDFTTQMSNLKGVTPEGSGMAWDLYVKSQYLDGVNPGRSLVLASGTPVTNTMAELFTISRYLQPKALEERGLSKFDAWAGAFGESVAELEQDAAGNYKAVSRFAKFVNVAELSAMVRQVMDVVTSRQLDQYVTRPKMKNGKRSMNLAEKSPELIDYQNRLAARMKAIEKRRGAPQKGDDIMLSVINDGRHAAIDMRLVGQEKSRVPSKLDELVDNVFDKWQATKRQPFYNVVNGAYDTKPAFHGPATQLVFINLGLSGNRGFSVPDYIRAELTRRGVPKSEVAYIYDYKSSTQKQKLFNDMNEGKVRILMGSVAKMGTGTNVQKRLAAIHNMDPLWYPSDDEQRNGRGVRQGNMNPEIDINDYATKGTYDSTMWGMMERKARFIQGFFEGDPTLREMDDLGEASHYEQAKALTTNDPRLIKLTELRQTLERANRRKAAHDNEAYALRQRRVREEASIEHATKRIGEVEKDIAQRIDTRGDAFKGTVGKQQFETRVDFGEALLTAQEKVEKANSGQPTKIAEIGGFPLYAISRKSLTSKDITSDIYLARNGDAEREITGTSSLGLVRSIESALAGFDGDLADYKDRQANAERFLKESAGKSRERFAGNAEITELTEQVRNLESELARPVEEPTEESDEVASAKRSKVSAAEKKYFDRSKPVGFNSSGQVVYENSRGIRSIWNDGDVRSDSYTQHQDGTIEINNRPTHLQTVAGLASAARRTEISKMAEPHREQIRSMLRTAIRKLVGDSVAVKFSDGLIELKNPPKGYNGVGTGDGAAGTYSPGRALIQIALVGDERQIATATFHEAYHAIEDKLQTDEERLLMKRETPRLREMVKRTNRGYTDEELDKLAGFEIRALAFEHYAYERATKSSAEAGEGLHMSVRRWFEKLWDVIRAIANKLRGLGFKTYKDVFSDAFEGKMADRNPRSAGLEEDTYASAFRRAQDENVTARLNDLMKPNITEKFVEGYQNLSLPMKRLQDAVEARMDGTLPDTAAFYTKKRLFPGKLAAEIADFNKSHLDPLVDYLKSKNLSLEQASDILYALHAPERNAAMEAINHPALDGSDADYIGKRSGMSDEEAAQILAQHPAPVVERIDRFADGIRDYIRGTMEAAGLESPDTLQGWKDKYEHYVPLSGWDVPPEDAPEATGRGGAFNVRGPESKQAFGRKSKAANPLVNLLDQAYRTVDRAKRNEYVRAAYNALDELEPDELKGFVRFDHGKPKKVIDKRTGLVTTVEDSSFRSDPRAVAFKIGGKTHYMVFESLPLAEAMKRMHADGIGFLQPLLVLQNKIKSMWTHYSPEFLERHFLWRYPIEGTINSFEQKESGEHSVARYIRESYPFLGNASKAIFATNKGITHADPEVAQMQQYWQEMRKAGGAMMFRAMRDIDMINEHMKSKLNSLEQSPLQTVKDKHQAAVEAMDTVTNALDNSLRLAAYASARRQGKSPQQAALIAREATVDFQQSGKWKNAMGIVFPFANVAIQTGARMSMSVARSRIMRRVFMGTMLAGFLSGMFNYLVGGDDKDGIPFMDKIPEWDRRLNFIVINPFHHDAKGHPVPIKIPLPYNWAFPYVIGSAMATMVFGKDKHSIRKMLGLVTKVGLEVATPFGQEENLAAVFAPELARPAIHIYTNKDYNGIPVHADPAFQTGPASQSGRKTTGDGWKFIASGVNTISGGDRRHSGALDFYPEDYRLLFDYVAGSQRRFVQNTIGTAKDAVEGKPLDYTHVPFSRTIMGNDYDAADRARHYERLRADKQPWLK